MSKDAKKLVKYADSVDGPEDKELFVCIDYSSKDIEYSAKWLSL